MIIVEDDLLLSPDFLEYFEANAPVLERDSNTLVLSAWNDNGYRGRVSTLSRCSLDLDVNVQIMRVGTDISHLCLENFVQNSKDSCRKLCWIAFRCGVM